jgi:hypothetical protein
MCVGFRDRVGIKRRKRQFEDSGLRKWGRKLSKARSVKLEASKGRAAAEPANGGLRA